MYAKELVKIIEADEDFPSSSESAFEEENKTITNIKTKQFYRR